MITLRQTRFSTLLLSLAIASCGGGSSGSSPTGSAGTGPGGTTATGDAGSVGASGAAGTTGVAGSLGGAGTGGSGSGAAGTGGSAGGAGTAGGGAGTTGTAGSTGAAGTKGSAGSTGAAGTGTAGTAGGAGSTGAAGSTPGAHWMPKSGTTWQWQLTGTIDTTVDVQMYDIDLFESSTTLIKSLQTAGRAVVCYFSAGSYEPDRPDSAALMKTGLGKTLDGWPAEKWLDIRSAAVRQIMQARLDTAKSKGCDGVEPDNVDGFDNDNGLGLTKQDQLDYNTFLATEGHARGLSVGLKNALALVTALQPSFDWALNEECLKYDECDGLAPFVKANKAVFHCEYAKSTTGICDKNPAGFSTIVKDLDLDAFRLACP
jgi:Glycoside-hydrolase family GH114